MKLPTRKVSKISHAEAGELVRKFREHHNVSLRKLALKMKFSAAFLSDMERGRRNWTTEKFELAERSIRELAKQ